MDYLGTQLTVPGFKLSGGTPGTGKVIQSTDGTGVAAWKGSNAVAIPFALTPGTNCTAVTKTGTVHTAQYLSFTQDVDGFAYGQLRTPYDVVLTNATIILSYACWTATSGVARLNVNASLIANNESLDPGSYAFAGTAVDSTVPGTAKLRKDVSWAISSLSGGWAAGDDLFVRFDHLGAHANDTLADALLLTEAMLYYEIV